MIKKEEAICTCMYLLTIFLFLRRRLLIELWIINGEDMLINGIHWFGCYNCASFIQLEKSVLSLGGGANVFLFIYTSKWKLQV